MRLIAISLTVLSLCSCASYSGRGLKPGESNLDDVIRTMGAPAMRWQDPDGTMQLAYPRGPWGFDTYMVFVGREGKLQRIEDVLNTRHLSLVRAGMTKDQVLRILGPSVPAWTEYYRARDELAWEWRYCSEWGMATRFDVLFDGSKGTVRSTLSRTESCRTGGCLC